MNRNRKTMRGWLVLLTALAAAAGVLLGRSVSERPGAGAIPALAARPAQETAAAAAEEVRKELKTGPEPGMRAPAFTLQGRDGSEYRLGGERGKAVLLNFWVSWCGPCRDEAPALNRIAEAHAGKLDVYGINVTGYDDRRSAERMVRKYGLKFPILYDTDGSVYRLYRGTVFPTSILIDRNGVVTEVIVGGLNEERLGRALGRMEQTVEQSAPGHSR
ncbi:TlpA family protein disulfide reductase [Paenibacillus spiritus]|uniref:TlpA family protein disulfide reductase n=1 Tax=Paenibacillus spiritus TaxID=2496557 RepID=A0A5J5G7X4_9BACL|nr:TlpA disulfide reductase family protein [Paenibacillus spiritus]KAA9003910.1 TlpA family protein disulfide reductase [Paenibacillus spiritus]